MGIRSCPRASARGPGIDVPTRMVRAPTGRAGFGPQAPASTEHPDFQRHHPRFRDVDLHRVSGIHVSHAVAGPERIWTQYHRDCTLLAAPGRRRPTGRLLGGCSDSTVWSEAISLLRSRSRSGRLPPTFYGYECGRGRGLPDGVRGGGRPHVSVGPEPPSAFLGEGRDGSRNLIELAVPIHRPKPWGPGVGSDPLDLRFDIRCGGPFPDASDARRLSLLLLRCGGPTRRGGIDRNTRSGSHGKEELPRAAGIWLVEGHAWKLASESHAATFPNGRAVDDRTAIGAGGVSPVREHDYT